MRYSQSAPQGIGGGLNWYAYGEGNPLTEVDVDGLGCGGKKPRKKGNNKKPKQEKTQPKSKSNPTRDKPNMTKKDQLRQNREAGRRREQETRKELEQKYPHATVQKERYLRDAEGKIVKDPLTNKGRRMDHVVIQEGKALKTVETTSQNVDKTSQIAKEMRIREAGGNFIKDRDTGKLINLDNLGPSEILRKP